MNKVVSHPSHYQTEEGIETIDVIRAFTRGLNGVVAFDIGNALKYICRWPKKGGVNDLRKAIWYLNHALTILEPNNAEKEIIEGNENEQNSGNN